MKANLMELWGKMTKRTWLIFLACLLCTRPFPVLAVVPTQGLDLN